MEIPGVMRPRFPSLKRDDGGKLLCRGCGNKVPPHRKTWCSTECQRNHHPGVVRHLLFKRDKGVCAECSLDTYQLRQVLEAHARDLGFYGSYWRIDADRIPEPYRTQWLSYRWPAIRKSWWDMAHVVPHSEGGSMSLENMKTLCIPCHKKETAAWRKARKANQ